MFLTSFTCKCVRGEGNYRENEIESQLENGAEEIDSSPHHLQVDRSHKVGPPREVGTFSCEVITMGM